MSPPHLVSKMINALLLIIPSQATWKESQDIFNYAAGVTEMMRFQLVSMTADSLRNML